VKCRVALENVALWHERDISHSSAERIILPDSCILLDYMLTKLRDIVEKLHCLSRTDATKSRLDERFVFQPIDLACSQARAWNAKLHMKRCNAPQ